MRQMVHLRDNVEKFAGLNTEFVFVFREERQEVEGLKKIRKRINSKFTLLTDLGAKATKPYSPKRRQFANYVIDKKGIVRGIVDGSLRKRANTEQLLKILNAIENPGKTAKSTAPAKGAQDTSDKGSGSSSSRKSEKTDSDKKSGKKK